MEQQLRARSYSWPALAIAGVVTEAVLAPGKRAKRADLVRGTAANVSHG